MKTSYIIVAVVLLAVYFYFKQKTITPAFLGGPTVKNIITGDSGLPSGLPSHSNVIPINTNYSPASSNGAIPNIVPIIPTPFGHPILVISQN